MFTAIGKFFTSVAIGISSLFGIHHAQPVQPVSVLPAVASSTSSTSTTSAVTIHAAKAVSPTLSTDIKTHTTAPAVAPIPTKITSVSTAPTDAVQPSQPDGNAVCSAMNAVWDGAQASNGHYNCSCRTGYVASTDGTTCVVAQTKSGYQICSESYPNETWDGTYSSSGNYNCTCQSGYSWDQDSQSCISNQQAQAQSACNAQIAQLQQQVSELRQKASALEAGELTSGTAAIAQGNAQRTAQIEAQQEQPLLAQIQTLQSTCN